jgi:uncharacterized protein (TIGR02246 family)
LKIFPVFVALLVCLSFTSSGQDKDMQIIKTLNQQWLDAIAKKDSAALSQILAADFVLIVPNGAKHNKSDNLLNMMSPAIAFSVIHVDSVEVRILSKEVGIITCWTSFVVKADGKKTPGKNCYQDVYVKRKGKWVAVAGHVTLLSAH